MTEQILLNKNKSKVFTNYNNSLAVQLKGSKRILPCDPMEATINEIDVYNNEREKCSKIRLTVKVNPICSNVLFNNLTEIVKNEGSDNVLWFNYGNQCENDLNSLSFKDKNHFCATTENGNNNSKNAIKDTQLNNEANGYIYHCGVDIFNNHLLRSKTFKTVCPLSNGTDKNFNTLSDYMRNYSGKQVEGYSDFKYASKDTDLKLHLYMNDEILSYKETVSLKLFEKNGWFGFTNIGKLKVYDIKLDDGNDTDATNYDWFKVINNRKPCDFIDMYPERDLFFFDPKYNHERRRIEKNWDYCITYPSSSTTDVPFIKTYSNKSFGLKIMYFDDTIKYKNGLNAIKFWSISKHGLKKDDIVNIYKGDEKAIINARVLGVDDEYIFYIFRDGVTLSKEWYNLQNKIQDNKVSLQDKDKNTIVEFNVSKDRTYLYNSTNTEKYKSDKYYIIDYKKVNIDDNAQDISFKRVIDGYETSYYVRIFSKLPNWKFRKEKPTELFVENNSDKIKEYQEEKNDFENHIGKLAFSKNIYNDNITEIVFTDDIDFSVLKDNLGRPLSELYLTIFKSNHGYREWYGKGYGEDGKIDINNEIVEYSHCFRQIKLCI